MMSKKDYKIVAGVMIRLLTEPQLSFEQWQLIREHLINTMKAAYDNFNEDKFRSYIINPIAKVVRESDKGGLFQVTRDNNEQN